MKIILFALGKSSWLESILSSPFCRKLEQQLNIGFFTIFSGIFHFPVVSDAPINILTYNSRNSDNHR